MSKLSRSVASALSFAHLTSASSKRARAENDEEKKSRRAEDEEDEKKARRAEGDDPDAADDDDGDDKKDARRASADEGDDEDDKHKSKKAKRADGDDPEDDPDAEEDDDEEEMRGSSTAAKARTRERARFATIFSSKYAAKNLPLAMSLACNTNMTRKQVLSVLRDAPAAQAPEPLNGGRAARNPNLGVDRADSPDRKATVASRWDRAMSKVRGA